MSNNKIISDDRKFTIYMKPEIKKELKIAAVEENTSASQIIEMLVRQYLAQRKKNNDK